MNTKARSLTQPFGPFARVGSVALLTLAAACGTSDRGDRSSVSDASVRVDGAIGADGGDVDGGLMPDGRARPDRVEAVDANDCIGVSENYVAAATTCGASLPGNAASTLEQVCRRGAAQASMCGADAAAGLACFVTPEPTDWTCGLGEPLPNCGGDLGAALGMYCLLALGNPACASGIACDLDIDCPSGAGCNDATRQCFDKNAYCVGLPCDRDIDCPNGQTCNDAERSCVGS